MDFRMTEEQELLVHTLEKLLEREIPESQLAELDEKHEFPLKAWQALAENGILGIGIPEEYGGTPADIMTMTLVCENSGKAGIPTRDYLFAGDHYDTRYSPVWFGRDQKGGPYWICSGRCAGGSRHY